MTGRGVAIRLFVSVWTVYSLFWTPFLIRELFPALALVERGSLNAERYVKWCEDIFPGPLGGAYMNNNPGASLTAAIPLAAVKPLLDRLDRANAGGRTDWVFPDHMFEAAAREQRGFSMLLAAFITVTGVNALSCAIVTAWLGWCLFQFGVRPPWAAAISLLYAFGTPVFFRAGYLNHNLLTANAGFLALLLLWNPAKRELSAPRAWAAGALCGYAILCDFTGLVAAAVAAGYLLARGRDSSGAGRLLVRFAAAASLGVTGVLLYQWSVFGNPLLPAQHYMPPTGPTAQGYRGFSWPSPTLAWANFFHPEFGLFAYCPMLALGLAAPFTGVKTLRIPGRETAVLLVYFAALSLFCAANQYAWLQWSTGFRYLTPIVPCLLLLTVQTLRVLPGWIRYPVVAFSLAGSVASVLTRHHHAGLALAGLLEWPPRVVWIERMTALEILPAAPWHGGVLLGAAAAVLAGIWGPYGWHGRPSTTVP